MAKVKFDIRVAAAIVLFAAMIIFLGSSGLTGFSIASGPDLVPAGYSYDVFTDSAGIHYQYALLVKNTGVADAGPFKTTLVSADGNAITSCWINGIAAGATDSCLSVADVQSAQVRLVVDSSADVAESNEDNNVILF
ncbi:MAG: CARDB domain-containing protein [archaeon]